MNIHLPDTDFTPKALMLSDIDIRTAYYRNEVYRACSDFTDYPDYPIYKGDYLIVAFNGVIVVGCDSTVLIDTCSLSQENWNVPLELTSCVAELTISVG